jgi:hypothetical protein
MKKNYCQGQIIILTTFSLIISISIIYIFLIPIFNTLKSIKETTDYYQAQAFANSGLEINYLFVGPFRSFDILNNTISKIGPTCYYNFPTNPCLQNLADITNPSTFLNRKGKYCLFPTNTGLVNYLNLMTTNTQDIVTDIANTNYNKFLIQSQGVYKNKLYHLKQYVWAVACD